jgi:hypothetical protein
MRPILSFLVLLPFATGSAFGWGCDGHRMVALIARAHLTPAVSSAVDKLLRENPIDAALKRFCKDRPGDLMADAATWADDARNIEKTADWHFIDIPLAIQGDPADEKEAMKWCKASPEGNPGCIVSALDLEWAILRDQSQPAPLRAKALRYVIHFVGDLAQPLHATDNHDRGGNCTEIGFFSSETNAKPENLHSIWDSKILGRDLEATKATPAQYARTLDREFARDESKVDVLAWTWDSHRLGAAVTYGDLKPPIPIAPAALGTADEAGCTEQRAAVAALHISIDDEYVSHALPAIREQLAKAGYRLAALLNRTLQ